MFNYISFDPISINKEKRTYIRVEFSKSLGMNKGVMQGKLIAVVYTLRIY